MSSPLPLATPSILFVHRWLFRSAKLRQILPQNRYNRSVLFTVTLFGCKIDFANLRRFLLRRARDRHNFPHMSQLAWWFFWTWCRTLFAFANQTFVSAVLHTQRILCFRESFPPTYFYLKHFFPIGPQVVQIVSGNILLCL